MPKSRQQNKQKKTKRNGDKKAPKNKRRPLTIFLSGAATAISLCAAIYSFWPHVGIEMNSSFDTLKSPYWATSLITNNGFLPLEDVTVGVRFGPFNYIPIGSSYEEAETICGPDIIDEEPFTQNGVGFANWKTDKLAMDQKFSVRMNVPIEVKSFSIYPEHPDRMIIRKPGFVKLFRLHMSIVVDYNLWILPIRFEKQQMFRTVPSKDCKNCLDWLYE